MMRFKYFHISPLGGVVVRPQGIDIKGGGKINKQYRINERQRLLLLDLLIEKLIRLEALPANTSLELRKKEINKLIKKFTLSEE